MKKSSYKVIKPFNLEKDENEDTLVVDPEEDAIPEFRVDSQYVDYEFPKQGLKKSKITEQLLKKGYIEPDE